jgi:hypothetical protein
MIHLIALAAASQACVTAPCPPPAVVLAAPAASVPATTRWVWRTVTSEGLAFPVWGFYDEAGAFNWSLADSPANVASRDRAAAAARPQAQAEAQANPKPEATPKAKPGPMAASQPTVIGDTSSPSPSAPAGTEIKLTNGTTAYGYGVDPFKLHDAARKKAETYHTNAPDEGAATHGKDLHLTVIGAEADRRPVMSDLGANEKLKAAASRAWVQEYDPGDWEIDPALKFPTGGRPDILIQDRAGRVLWRATSYQQAGPDGLAEALRRADPNYDPKDDPQPGGDGGPRLPLGSKEAWLAAIGVILLILILPPRSKT